MTQNTHNEDQLSEDSDGQASLAPSSEAYQAMLRDLAQSKDEIWVSLEQQVQELEDILAQYNPLDVIGNILFANAVFDAETYKEYAHEGSDAYIEYVILLLLTKPFDTYPERTLEPVPVGDIQQRIISIFNTMRQFLIVKDIDPERVGPPSNLMQLQARIVTESIFVRYPSYHHHLLDILTDLFTPLQTELENILGCTIQDALILIEAMEAMIERIRPEAISPPRSKCSPRGTPRARHELGLRYPFDTAAHISIRGEAAVPTPGPCKSVAIEATPGRAGSHRGLPIGRAGGRGSRRAAG